MRSVGVSVIFSDLKIAESMFFCQHLYRFGSANIHTGELTFHQSVSRLARRVENGNAEEEMELTSGGQQRLLRPMLTPRVLMIQERRTSGRGTLEDEGLMRWVMDLFAI